MIKTQISSLPHTLDPVGLYRALCTHFGRLNTLLLESADVHTRAGQKSFLMVKAALKFQARRDKVTVDALSPFGEFLLGELCKNPSLHIAEVAKNKVVFAVPRHEGIESLSEQLQAKSCLDVLRDAIKLYALAPGLSPIHFLVAGIFSYDLVDHFEKLPTAKSDPHEFPDYVFWLPEVFVVVDHINIKTELIQHGLKGGPLETLPSFAGEGDFDLSKSGEGKGEGNIESVDLSDASYALLVAKLKEHVVAGDVFQIVPSRTFSMPCADSLLAYEHLKALNPSPYMYYVVDEAFELSGASPETFIKLDAQTRNVEVKPIAGTRRRGFNSAGSIDTELDGRLEAELRLDTKELAEHMMLVDLARNDIARVAKLGSRHVHRLLSVERYSHVMHLVSHVQGELRSELDGLHAYQASMNMGTLVGAPKIRAAELLRQNELSKRGTYGGAIGYLDAAGNFDTAIVIRSAFIKQGVAYVRAGAGIVYDSVPLEETAETKSKASAVLKAIQLANQDAKRSTL